MKPIPRVQRKDHRHLRTPTLHVGKNPLPDTQRHVAARVVVLRLGPPMVVIGRAHFGEPMALRLAQSTSPVSLVAMVVADGRLEV